MQQNQEMLAFHQQGPHTTPTAELKMLSSTLLNYGITNGGS